jgi:DNA polymerase III subunit delta
MSLLEITQPVAPVAQVTILHGDDENAIQQAVIQIEHNLGMIASAADTAIATFVNIPLDDPALKTAVLTKDLFSNLRLVVVKNPIFPRSTKKKKGEIDPGSTDEEDSSKVKEGFLDLLNNLPDSTKLILCIEDGFKGGWDKGNWIVLGPGHWMVKWTEKAKVKAVLQSFKLPSIREMPAWIQKETIRQGGKISPQAAADLIAHFGNHTRQISLEIEKLLTYVGVNRQLEPRDVKALCEYGDEGNIFTLVEAIAKGDAKSGMHELHLLIQQQEDVNIFAMVVRQFRQLILTQQMLADKLGIYDVINEFRIPEFAAKKLVDQAHRFTASQLSTTYHRLLDIDAESKTNEGMKLIPAMETLIIDKSKR